MEPGFTVKTGKSSPLIEELLHISHSTDLAVRITEVQYKCTYALTLSSMGLLSMERTKNVVHF